MAPRKPRARRPAARKATRPAGPAEDRVAEFLTVAWMLSVFTTLVCELGSAAAIWYLRAQPQAVQVAALASVLLFAALVTGTLSLVLMAGAWRLRRVKPPPGVSVFALVVGVAPVVMLLVRSFL